MQFDEVSLSEIDTESMLLRSCTELARPVDAAFAGQLYRVQELICRIPAIERDVIELHFFKSKSQEQIGIMLGLTQQAVSHRMRRGMARLSFLLDHPELTVSKVRRDLRVVWPDAPDSMAQLLVHFSRTSSQTDTARHLKQPQQFVRRHLAAAVHRFKKNADPVSDRYLILLTRLLAHRSILCDVPRRVREGQRRTGYSRSGLTASA